MAQEGLQIVMVNQGDFLDEDNMASNSATKVASQQSIKAYVDTYAAKKLTYNNSTITGSNLSCSEDNVYNCTIAGLTANRNAVLPAPSAAGKYIRINILDGDATYALIFIGDAGVTINGGGAATEWSRAFIANENVLFESTSTSNWQVVIDGRIPCKGKMHQESAQTIADSTSTIIEHDTEDFDIGDIVDIANYRFVLRRAGKYEIKIILSFNLNDEDHLVTWVMLDGSAFSRFDAYHSFTGVANLVSESSVMDDFSVGAIFTQMGYHTYGANRDTLTGNVFTWPRMEIKEML